MATASVKDELPTPLEANSELPPLFDGTTRLYISYQSRFAQRVWITRNYKGLQDKIKLVPLNLQNRPAWYKEKVYPPNKVPSLEHNNKVIGESLDLIKYVDSNFEGPSLYPNDPSKRQFGEELLASSDGFNAKVYGAFKADDPAAEVGPDFDYLENALAKFDDGPFFLGQFSLVDVAYAPFIERYQNYFSGVSNYDITTGRPKLAAWIEAFYTMKSTGVEQNRSLYCDKDGPKRAARVPEGPYCGTKSELITTAGAHKKRLLPSP